MGIAPTATAIFTMACSTKAKLNPAESNPPYARLLIETARMPLYSKIRYNSSKCYDEKLKILASVRPLSSYINFDNSEYEEIAAHFVDPQGRQWVVAIILSSRPVRV